MKFQFHRGSLGRCNLRPKSHIECGQGGSPALTISLGKIRLLLDHYIVILAALRKGDRAD